MMSNRDIAIPFARGPLAALLASALISGACDKSSDRNRPLRLGHFPNITHAQGLVGSADGTFRRALGGRPLEVKVFNAGPGAMEALLAGALDVSYVGGSPALIAYVRSQGGVQVIAGAASGGSELIARHARTAEELRGHLVASPQIGNTQDLALQHWLRARGMPADSTALGVQVVPLPNADILSLFHQGRLEAAWVPEPWGERLISEGQGHILVDERDLWEGGLFPTTVLLATRRALTHRRDELKAILRAHLELTERWKADPVRFASQANEAYAKLTAHPLAPELLRNAFSRIEPTIDPMEKQLAELFKHARELGYLPNSNTSGLVDRTLMAESQSQR